MRYRKSVKICKGVRMNFSKSGASLTIGGRGCSVNVGKKGTYLNTGIPGTGLYDRQRIGGPAKPKQKSKSRQVATQSRGRLDYNPANEVEYSSQILDTTPLNDIQDESEFTEVYKFACDVQSSVAYAKMLESMKPKEYVIKPFSVEKPSIESVSAMLRDHFQKNVKGLIKTKAKEDSFVATNLEANMQAHLDAWINAKDKYYDDENRKKLDADKEYRQRFMIQKQHISKLLNNDEETVDQAVSSWLSNIEFPFEFNIDYMIQGDKLLVDLDLPEIEDMPTQYYRLMADGSYKLKDRSQKYIKEEYYQCIIGLAVCFITNLFRTAIGTNTIVLSAYTQRRNTAGAINDDYILSFKVNRDDIANKHIGTTFEAVANLLFSFEGQCTVLADKTFKSISPL